MGLDHVGGDIGMTEKSLDRTVIIARIELMGRVSVPQMMGDHIPPFTGKIFGVKFLVGVAQKHSPKVARVKKYHAPNLCIGT